MRINTDKAKSMNETVTEEDGALVKVKGLSYYIVIISPILSVLLAINYIFHLNLFGISLYSNQYLYLLMALLLPLNFINLRAFKSMPRNRVPWYDKVLMICCFLSLMYFVWHALDIRLYGWAYCGGLVSTGLSLITILMILEILRRSGNLFFLLIVLAISAIPLVAEHLPSIAKGQSQNIWDMVRLYLMEEISIIGIPMRVFGDLIIGFIFFGIVLEVTGGGKYFIDLSIALFGKTRGGPAKVSCLASGLFGSISGNVAANVVATGTFTIPMMRRAGYSGVEAAAIESCASTGGMIMPPVMGVVAFVMAGFLGMPYGTVIIYALPPAVLYYYSLIVQCDLIALRKGIKGLPPVDGPNIVRRIVSGWPYVLSLAVLIFTIIFLGIDSWAPFISSFLLLATVMVRPKTRLKITDFYKMFERMASMLPFLMGILGGVGLIMGSIFMTGVGNSFAREIVFVFGENIYPLLAMLAVASFILGLGMPAVPAYLILAIILSPSMEALGLNRFATHLFLLYWGVFSFVTPPVAIGAFVAASLAKEKPMAVATKAMGLAAISYFLPFFFVLNPIMVLQDFTLMHFLFVITTALIGIPILGGAIQNYFYFIGPIGSRPLAIIIRIFFGLGGFMMVAPSLWISVMGGALVIVSGIAWRTVGLNLQKQKKLETVITGL